MPTLRDRFAAARAGWVSGRSVRVPGTAPQWSAAGLRPRGARTVTGATRPAQQSPPPPQSRAQTAFQAVTALTAVAALLFTARSLDYTADATRATQDQIDLAAQGQLAQRFSQAIDQLGEIGPDKLSIRLGGIYSLERIMRDSPSDEPTVIEVLCAFIRTNARRPEEPVEPREIPAAPEDVRAAVTVLGRRPNPEHDRNSRLDLTGTQLSLPGLSLPDADLSGADLHTANLNGANLRGADLTGADLDDADLDDADLTGASLRAADLSGGADLSFAKLRDADLADANLLQADLWRTELRDANLTGADLRLANVTEADLTGADLAGADLRLAHLDGANLSGAKNLTSEMVRCSRVDDRTQLPPGVARPADVPPKDRASC